MVNLIKVKISNYLFNIACKTSIGSASFHTTIYLNNITSISLLKYFRVLGEI